MDHSHFDRFARLFAERRSRRAAIAGGVAAAVAGSMGRSMVLAQDATPVAAGPEICLVPFEATVRQGPDAGTAYTGLLALTADASGAVRGTLVPSALATPTAASKAGIGVVGQTAGRAINLLFATGGGRDLYGVGVLERPLAECTGAMGGPFVGPDPGDAGDWRAQAQPLTSCQLGCRADFSRCSSSLSEEELNAEINKCDLALGGCLTGCDLNGR